MAAFSRIRASSLFSVFAGLFLLCGWTLAEAGSPIPSPPSVDAGSYVLMDYRTGRTLAEKDADRELDPASITKVMTAYVVFDALADGTISLEDQVTVSERAWRMAGSRMFIEVGRQVAVEDLLQGMIIQSGNDASVALAEHVAGSEEAFVDLMNQYADRLGLDSTRYQNATGMPVEDHYTTARDIAVLARALVEDFPEYYHWYSERHFTYNGIRQDNRNLLLWRDDSVDGIKTGHTSSAGYCLLTSAKRDDMRLISVVMDSSDERSRADASQSLLNYGFRFFETHRLYETDETLSEERLWGGEIDKLRVGLKEDLYVTVPRGQYRELEPVMNLPEQLEAPIQAGDELGTVKVSLNGEVLAEAPLYALEDGPRGALWKRLVDRVRLFFQ